MFELVRPGTHIDFIGRRRVCGVISVALLLAGLLAVPLRGVKLGIDFAGGTEVQVGFAEGVAVNEESVRRVVTACGIASPDVIRYGDTDVSDYLIRFQTTTEAEEGASRVEAPESCPLSEADRERLAELSAAAGGDEEIDKTGGIVDRLALALANEIGAVEVERVEFVGPRVGAELRRDGLLALGIACLLILAYIAMRFSTRFAPGAIVALVHDVGITAGLFVIFGLEFDLRVLAALLAILGYSLNDTIIIYDRIRENMELHTKHDLLDVLNRSVNQTLSRTVLTSGTTMAAVLSLLFVGGEVLRPFAIAMSIGIIVGTYSSVFIAAPTLLFLEQRMGEAGATPRPERPVERSEAPALQPTRPRGGKRSKRGKRSKSGRAKARA